MQYYLLASSIKGERLFLGKISHYVEVQEHKCRDAGAWSGEVQEHKCRDAGAGL